MTGAVGSHDRRSAFGRAGVGALGVTIALTATSVIVPALLPDPGSRGYRELQHYFDVTADSSLPAWWITSLLLAGALAHAVAGFATRLGRIRGAWCWFIGAAVLAVLSLNEHALLSERLETLSGALVAVTGFPRPVLAAGVAGGLVVATALGLLAARERGRTRWLLVAGAILLAGATAAGVLVQNLVASGATGLVAAAATLVEHAGWFGSAAGVLLLTAGATSAVSVTPDRSGVRVCHRRVERPAGIAAPVPVAVPDGGPREQEVPA